MIPERKAVLLAFHEESDVLTKREIIQRANLKDEKPIMDLLAMALLAMREWQPNVPRLYYLTPRGMDKRAECNVGD